CTSTTESPAPSYTAPPAAQAPAEPPPAAGSQDNASAPQADMPPPIQEEPADAAPPAEAIAATDESAADLLDSALAEWMRDFYLDHSGTYTEGRFSWTRSPSPSDGTLTASPASQVKFDGKTIESVQSLGYLTFTDKNGALSVYGAAVFSSEQTLLDGLFSPFDVDVAGRNLSWCQVAKKDTYQSTAGGFLSVYRFECEYAE
ncbi:MAG: hypothetical protein ACOY58_05080, partial [Candidatus Micrarchaeota archaeon]